MSTDRNVVGGKYCIEISGSIIQLIHMSILNGAGFLLKVFADLLHNKCNHF